MNGFIVVLFHVYRLYVLYTHTHVYIANTRSGRTREKKKARKKTSSGMRCIRVVPAGTHTRFVYSITAAAAAADLCEPTTKRVGVRRLV